MTGTRVRCVLLLALSVFPGCGDTATQTSPTTSPVTVRFDGQFAQGGSAARTFTAAAHGAVTITLTSIGPPEGTVVGLGIGIPRGNASGCLLTHVLDATAASSPQIAVAVDAGDYCARVFDVGNLSNQVAFSLTIVHP